MGFDPQRFFIGVIDLFSVILPGMIATFVLEAAFGEELAGDAYADLSDSYAVVAFLVASYVFGHFIFLIGALVLDAAYKKWAQPSPALRRVEVMAMTALEGIGAGETMNGFQWSKARLLLEQPMGLSKVERFEADSKFFRSLAVLFVLMMPVLAYKDRWVLLGTVAVLTPFAVWRYYDQRRKSIDQAAIYVIAVEAAGRA